MNTVLANGCMAVVLNRVKCLIPGTALVLRLLIFSLRMLYSCCDIGTFHMRVARGKPHYTSPHVGGFVCFVVVSLLP